MLPTTFLVLILSVLFSKWFWKSENGKIEEAEAGSGIEMINTGKEEGQEADPEIGYVANFQFLPISLTYAQLT